MIGAVVVAAGLSSRMGVFKPLLSIGDTTIAVSTVRRLLEGGAHRVVVVTGNRAPELRRALQELPVNFVHNECYSFTQMFDSVKIGLMEVGECDAVFITPVDIPMVSPRLLKRMLAQTGQEQVDAVCPRVAGNTGHPLLLCSTAFQSILKYCGNRGLKGALRGLRLAFCDTDDIGCLLDADTKEEYHRILRFRAEKAPTDSEIASIHSYFASTHKVFKHCQAVRRKALELAQLPVCTELNWDLLSAAALVHDAARSKSCHAARITQRLLAMGYTKMAEIVSTHMDLLPTQLGTVTESTILYLADKLVIEDKPVTLQERFAYAERKCMGNAEALASMTKRQFAAQSILNRISGVLI